MAPTHNASTTGPLHGIRVLDLTTVVLGPYATQILGDYGAEVIKVESLEGDLMRANGVARHPGMSSIFLAINRNKRSVALDLKKLEGRRVFLELVAGVDVVVHNMRVAAIDRLGLGYEAAKAVNPKVVYCAATGFGQDGPHGAKPSFDDIVQAASGLASLVGSEQGSPSYVPALIADKTAGLALVNAVLAALLHRERSGEGQYVEVPMFETLVEFNLVEHLAGLAFEPPLGGAGYGRIVSGGRRPLRTADGHAAILPYNPAQWVKLFRHLGREDILARSPIGDRHELNATVRQLYAALAGEGPKRTTAQWMEICEQLDLPATPIYSLDELPEHPHLKAVGLFQMMEHPSEGVVRYVRPAVRFSASPASVRLPAPRLGQDTASVLAQQGYSGADIASLQAAGVITT
jgi:crotonobetainyl-CoA:carnitine CoA-transferase CaiB-like acyl-CoA transferase